MQTHSSPCSVWQKVYGSQPSRTTVAFAMAFLSFHLRPVLFVVEATEAEGRTLLGNSRSEDQIALSQAGILFGYVTELTAHKSTCLKRCAIT
jgi:hypothetical protein